jgi:hypothetical protein
MDDQLVIDSSGAWVEINAAQLTGFHSLARDCAMQLLCSAA